VLEINRAGDLVNRRDFIGAAIGALVAALLLLACRAEADSPPPKAKVDTEWIGRTSSASIYTFKQGANRCYVAQVAYEGVAISCLREEP
jgi:hypothetical protein